MLRLAVAIFQPAPLWAQGALLLALGGLLIAGAYEPDDHGTP